MVEPKKKQIKEFIAHLGFSKNSNNTHGNGLPNTH